MSLRERRRKKIRAKIKGSADFPRLSVFRSSKHIEAQVVDDVSGKTLAYTSSKNITGKDKMEIAEKIGKSIGEQCKKIKITKVKFDRGGFAYHGRVKALADGARSAGLKI